MKQGDPIQEAKYLTGAVIFVVALFLFSVRLFLVEPPASPSSGLSREPASQKSSPGAGPVDMAPTAEPLETLQWDCQDYAAAPQFKGSHLRLKSRFCDKSEPQELKVTNHSNGYTAAVFINASGFSTDFIDLKDGMNQISIEWTSGQGQKVKRDLSVVREPALEAVQNSRTE